VDVAYEREALTASNRTGRFVEVVDRFFFLVWIGFYFLLPVSGWASIMFRSWFDQKRDLAALRSVIATGHADAVSDNVIGPAYIAAGRVLHDVLRLSPEDALVVLTRGSYVLSAALGVVLVRVLLRGLTGAPPLVTLGGQFAFVGLVFAAGTWHWSDVPWSHFVAAFLAVAIYAARFVPARLTVASAVAIGAGLALLSLTRSFELLAVLLAWGMVGAALWVLRLSGPRTLRLAHVVSGSCAFVTATAAVYLLTGKREPFLLYGSHLGNQSGNLPSAEIAETPTFSFSLVPTKLVQLFVEPCYGALCSLSDYSGGARPLPPELLPSGVESAGNERLWRLPLAIQLPSLLLLPFCTLALAGIVIWAVRHRGPAQGKLRAIRLGTEMTIASAGLVLGYSASTLTGSPHLRYGFARDFLLPALLIGIVSVGLLSAGLWLALSRLRGRRISPEFAFVTFAVVGSACLVLGLACARANGIPRLETHKLGSVVYTASCRGETCAISIAATSTQGRSIAIPEASTLTFGCASQRPRFTLYKTTPTAGVRLSQACADPRLVAAWPTVMGLPPGAFELSAVRVRNA
jgi:hypothetical protein